MSDAFKLLLYPWMCRSSVDKNDRWENPFYIEKSHTSAEDEARLPHAEYSMIANERNQDPFLPLVNYTTQYGFGCFEGLKAFPQPDGTLSLFRPHANASRMHRSMTGLHMRPLPEDLFLDMVCGVVNRNYDCGFFPKYDPQWENSGFVDGHSIYIRPFSYAEPGIGLNLSAHPWVIVIATPVSHYFDPNRKSCAITTKRIRATANGTGGYKCTANYVIPILAKYEAQQLGYMEAIFLDAQHQKYIEECSSCNIFLLLDNGVLVTPILEDRILPGINRDSVIILAKKMGITVEERPITIDEALEHAKEVFVTGTAAGISYFESITHNERTKMFNNGQPGELTVTLRNTLKGIQYGAIEDRNGWMYKPATHKSRS